jgi:hypothetical protein
MRRGIELLMVRTVRGIRGDIRNGEDAYGK